MHLFSYTATYRLKQYAIAFFTALGVFLTSQNVRAQQYGPNNYQLVSYHQDWHTFYSTTVVGTSTLNMDTTGVLVICDINISNSCILRVDMHGTCLTMGNQRIRISVDGKSLGSHNFICAGRPVQSHLVPSISTLAGKFTKKIEKAMLKGHRINFDLVDSTNSSVGIQGSLIGFTSSRQAMRTIRSKLNKR